MKYSNMYELEGKTRAGSGEWWVKNVVGLYVCMKGGRVRRDMTPVKLKVYKRCNSVVTLSDILIKVW